MCILALLKLASKRGVLVSFQPILSLCPAPESVMKSAIGLYHIVMVGNQGKAISFVVLEPPDPINHRELCDAL